MAPLVAFGYAFAFAAAAFLPTVTAVSPPIDNSVPRLPENGKCPDGYQFQPPNLEICVWKLNSIKCSDPAIAARCTAKNAVCRNTDSGTGYKCVCLAGFRNIRNRCLALRPAYGSCKLPGGQIVADGSPAPPADKCSTCTCKSGVVSCSKVLGCNYALNTCKLSNGATVASGTGGHPAGDGCNTCGCNNGALVCTMTPCIAIEPSLPCKLANGTLVPSGDTIYPKADGCNSCRCKNGALECITKMYCGGVGPTPIIEPPLPCKLSSGATVPSGTGGHLAADGCNTCTCTNGALTCTKTACLPLTCKLANGAIVESGTGGHAAGDGCNTCTCNNGALACTKTACIAIEPPRPCKLRNGTMVPSGTQGKDDCNFCSCNNGVLVCTMMACPPASCKLSSGATVASGTGGHPAGDGCNTCTCNNGALTCTKTACNVLPPEPFYPEGQSCQLFNGNVVPAGTGNHPAGDGCNTCQCTDTGVLACTKLSCGNQGYAEPDY